MNGIRVVFKHPFYPLLAVILAFFTLGVIVWSLNLDLLEFILFKAPLSVLGKLDFLLDIYGGIFTNYESLQVMLMLLLSVLLGVNLSLLIYVIKGRVASRAASGSSLMAAIFGVLAGGCAACGTSLLAPLLASVFGITSAQGASDFGNILFLLAIVLILFSIYRLGIQAANAAALTTK